MQLLRLNKQKPIGHVTPPWTPPGCDRPARYEQDGVLFDQNFIEVRAGVPFSADKPAAPVVKPPKQAPPKAVVGNVPPPPPPVDVAPAAETVSEPVAAPAPSVSAEIAATLLAAQAGMPWLKFRNECRKVLGVACPQTKDEIVALLEALAKVPDEVDPDAEVDDGNGVPVTDPPPAAVAAPQKKGPVDLRAWGSGQREYIFGEIQKAIRAQFSVQVTERRDAIDLLVDKGVINAAQARKDI